MALFRRKAPERFTRIEQMVLDAVRGALADDLRGFFDDHLASVNLVQRYDYGEVNMYRVLKKKVFFPETKFPTEKDEQVLATVMLRAEGRKKPIRSRVWVVNKHLFQIDFDVHHVEKIAGSIVVESVTTLPLS